MLTPDSNSHIISINPEERNPIFEMGQKIIAEWTRPLIYEDMINKRFPLMMDIDFKHAELMEKCRALEINFLKRPKKREMIEAVIDRVIRKE